MACSRHQVRKAVQLAVDVDSVLDGAFFGQPSVRPASCPGSSAIAKTLGGKLDLAKAKQLLAEAGHPNASRPRSVRNSAEFISAAQVIARARQVGIIAEVTPFASACRRPWPATRPAWKKMQMHVVRFSMQPDPAWATPGSSPTRSRVELERISNKEFDELQSRR